jgi:outer membrane protein TolC
MSLRFGERKLKNFLGFICALVIVVGNGPVKAQELDGKSLSLKEAVRMALEQNLDLSIERVNPLIAHEQIGAEQGAFDPVFSLFTPFGRSERPVNSALEQLESGLLLQRTFSPETSFMGKLHTGTQYGLSLVSPLLTTNNPQRIFTRSYQPVLAFNLTQPLLKDFGIEVNLVKVRQAEKNEKKALLGVESKMLTVIRDVEISYGTLFFAQQQVKVAQGGLSLAQDLVERLTRMKETGLATALDVLEAKSAVDARRADLVRARGEVVKGEAQLRLLIDPRLTLTRRILASDAPAEGKLPERVQDIMERALSKRPQIPEQEIVIENLALEERLAENNTLWRLDLVGTVGFTGLAGRGLGPNVTDLPKQLEDRDTFGEAFADYFTRKSMNWLIGMQLKIPIGNREAQAKLEGTRLRRRQEELRLSLLKSQIGVEVESAFYDVMAEQAKLIAARGAASVAREQLIAQEKELAAGRTTVRKVLEAQDSLARAEGAEIQALVSYGNVRARLDAAQGLSFDTYGLVIQR